VGMKLGFFFVGCLWTCCWR